MKRNPREKQANLIARANQRGFTLVELMITMVVSSVVIAAIYQVFATTSETMYEVDTLSEMTERSRFAIELISRDVRSAGAFSSPDSDNDLWRSPNHVQLNGNYHVRALILRPGAQDQILPQQQVNNAHWGSNNVSGDELILVGALDFPFTFEVNGLTPGYPNPVQTLNSPPNNRGVYRFFKRDPFDTSLIPAGTLLAAPLQNALFGASNNSGPLMGMRGLRIVDRNGFMQFAPLDSSTSFNDVQGLNLVLDTAGSSGFTGSFNGFMYRQGGQRDGLEPSSEQDMGYEASLLDAYRYRLCVDDKDGRNIRLVRERIAFGSVMNGILPNAPPNPMCNVTDPDFGMIPSQHQVPIVDNVVDFQVWADCALPNGDLDNLSWQQGWLTPVGNVAPNNCLTNDGTENVLLARMLHIRISVRTVNERRDLENFGFFSQNLNINDGTTPDPAQAGSSLQTYDINGDHSTAARIKTFQIDLDLANFAGARAANPAAPVAN